jgi:hypothetical protein
VEETSCAKDGHNTACTQRPWCGALGNPGAPGFVPKSCADGPAVFIINNAGDSFTVTGG